MTVLSSLIGFALPNLLPKQYTHYAAAILFLYFGYVARAMMVLVLLLRCSFAHLAVRVVACRLKLVYDATQMEADEVSEELQEVSLFKQVCR